MLPTPAMDHRPDHEILRHARRLMRHRSATKPTFVTTTEHQARSLGYKPVTHPFAVRQHEQCAALQSAIQTLGTIEHLLVLVGTRITIWRK